MQELSENEIYEKIREKVFVYVTYQKRTEAEVRNRFFPIFKKYNVSKDLLDDLVQELKEKGHIDDKDFVRRTFLSYFSFKSLSIKEIKYKLLKKGVHKDYIEDYIDEHKERLYKYEFDSAKKLYKKKIVDKSPEEVKQYLLKKGYMEDIVNQL